MGRVVVSSSVSLDGMFEGPGQDLGWSRIDEELHQHFNDHLGAMSAFVSGRVTYDLMAAYWPTADADPDATPVEVEFARIWREMPKVVYSRTMADPGGNTTVLREVDPEQVRGLAADGDIVVGGARLMASFRALDLIDEYRIYVHPVVLGDGTPLFAVPGGTVDLRLMETRVFGSGVVLLRYETDRDGVPNR